MPSNFWWFCSTCLTWKRCFVSFNWKPNLNIVYSIFVEWAALTFHSVEMILTIVSMINFPLAFVTRSRPGAKTKRTLFPENHSSLLRQNFDAEANNNKPFNFHLNDRRQFPWLRLSIVHPWSSLDKEESLACQVTFPFNNKVGSFLN